MKLQLICQGLLLAFIATVVAHKIEEDVSDLLDPYDYTEINRQKRAVVMTRQNKSRKRDATAIARRQYHVQHRKSFKKTIQFEELGDLQVDGKGLEPTPSDYRAQRQKVSDPRPNNYSIQSQNHHYRKSEHEESDEEDHDEPDEEDHDEPDEEEPEERKHDEHDKRNTEDGEEGKHSDRADGHAHHHGEHADDDDDGIED